MNPDVFITLAFAGIVVLVALVALATVAPQIRREQARLNKSETAKHGSGAAAQ
jgi:hypothetical protein